MHTYVAQTRRDETRQEKYEQIQIGFIQNKRMLNAECYENDSFGKFSIKWTKYSN